MFPGQNYHYSNQNVPPPGPPRGGGHHPYGPGGSYNMPSMPPYGGPGPTGGYPPPYNHGPPQPPPGQQMYGGGGGGPVSMPMPSGGMGRPYGQSPYHPEPLQNGYHSQPQQQQQQLPLEQDRRGRHSRTNDENNPPTPPSGAVEFGHGAPSGYKYQYSNCKGRRKALLIGINYFGMRGQLRGCINDVKNLSTYLNEHFNYRREDMVLLTDDQQNPMSKPTKANIIRAMHWLVKDARPNDSLFFHYSGHGGQVEDVDGDEEDGYDEVIYPVDFEKAGPIVDDEMHRIMVQDLKPGVRLTAIFDSCHSGSALDLPYVYSTQGILKEPNLAKETGQGLLSMVSQYASGDIGGMLSSGMSLLKRAAIGDSVYKKNLRTKTSPADVIMWSGSKDSQTSSDAHINGEATGALSFAFVRALKKNPHQSYLQLLNNIRNELDGKYSQKPQLSCSHPLNVNLLYVM